MSASHPALDTVTDPPPTVSAPSPALRWHATTRALFALTALLATGVLAALPAVEYRFPADANIIDVKRDFAARGDGTTDDTAAIRKAVVSALTGDFRNPKFVYFPNGTYLVSDAIRARVTEAPDGKGGWSDGWRSGMVLIGQSREGTVIKLMDRSPGFADKAKPRAMISPGSTNHSDASGQNRIGGWGNEGFQNSLMNFTVDSGRGNPGAVGVRYLASNRGTMEDITVRSGDPDKIGVTGVELTGWPGPALVKNVAVDGFDVGLLQDGMDCSMVYEHITLTGQKVCAVRGTHEPFMSMRGIVSRNAVPAFVIDGNSAIINILDSTCTYTGSEPAPPAITSTAHLVLKNLTVVGYPTVLAGPAGKKGGSPPPVVEAGSAAGTQRVAFYTSRPRTRLHPGPESVPDLPVKETPTFHHNDFTKWANVVTFAKGSRTGGLQEAIDSGAEIVYLPNGHHRIEQTVVLRGALRKIIGCEAVISGPKGLDPFIRFDGVASGTVILEHLGVRGGDVEHNCAQTLVMRKCDGGYRNTVRGTGDIFLEDGIFDHPRILHPQHLWARQLNSEFGDRPNFTNRGGTAWILGYKVEGWVSAILNIGGVTECYALYAMTGNEKNLKVTPFVENREGWVVVSLRDGGQGNHWVKIKDAWDGALKQQDTWQREYCCIIAGQAFDPAAIKPGAPGAAQGQALSASSAEITWGAAEDQRLGLSHYRIARNGEPVGAAAADKPTFTDTGLAERTAYTYEITAVNQRGGISAPVRVALTTPADTVAPKLLRAEVWPGDIACVVVDFSKAMDATSAGASANYVLNPATAISKVTLSRDGTRAILTCATPLVDGQAYTLTCSGLKDRSQAGQALTGATVTFTAWLMGDGLRAQFWNHKDSFDGAPVATRIDRVIDRWWGNDAPADGVTAGAFSARWTGELRPRVGGEYVFNTGVVSGARITLDGKVVHDVWNTGKEWTWSKPVQLEAGRRYAFVFETHATAGSSGARLKWKGPGFADSRFIDQDCLFSAPRKP